MVRILENDKCFVRMDLTRMKVVWICQVSNESLRKHLNLVKPLWRHFRGILRGNFTNTIKGVDYAQWNSNALVEFNSLENIDLHVIFTHPNMEQKEVRFNEGRISFYAENMSDNSFLHTFLRKIRRGKVSYDSWTRISKLVDTINPDIVHVMGAENPQYSLSCLLISRNIPVLVQLQTLLHAKDVVITDSSLEVQKICEYKTLQRADYIGTSVIQFAKTIHDCIRKDVDIINTRLMITEKKDLSEHEGIFDFVYFANSISKAADLAIEAFGIAHRKHPEITLDIVGGTTNALNDTILKRAKELGCQDAITIEGKLPTHDDVIRQIKKARFALLPLKFDVLSGTIREAIWNGLPVVTTITSGTPALNNKRQSALLSVIGNHEEMAFNMCKLLDNPNLVVELRRNAVITADEMYRSNEQVAREWVIAYKACIDHFRTGKPIPKGLMID